MKKTVIVAPQARGDLSQIVAGLATVASIATARRWNERLWSTIEGLAEFPGDGAPRSRLGKNIRIKIVTPYILIYEHERDASDVYVLRVIHGRRRISQRLLRV
jgi:toxin ParE1/3/4